MFETPSFMIADFSLDGKLQSTRLVDREKLADTSIEFFQKKFKYLSGDLELPLEGRLPGDFPHIDFRIGSDLNGACVFYFFHDEVIFGSLMLRGVNEQSEMELAQLFRFRLLESDDVDEPNADEIEEILGSPEFDLSEVTERPVVFSVQFSEREDESAECEHIRSMNQNMAAAFFSIERKVG